MPTPLEQYRAWEREAPATVCHVMIIHAGDGSAAQRITLTDKPYRDKKGSGGVKYHHTYPAPIQCIFSEVTTREDSDGASFGNVTISRTESGAGEILSTGQVISKPFVIYRGDTSYSLLEDEYPSRFVEVCRGTIEGASSKVRSTTLTIKPAEFDLDKTVGSRTEPWGAGQIYNAKAVLVNSASLKYRCNSILTSTSSSAIEIKDNGVPLTSGTDYTLINEDESLSEDPSGEFRGKFQLTSSPEGVVTVDMNYASSMADTLWLLTRMVRDNFHPQYPSESNRYNTISDISGRSIYFKPDGSKAYVSGRNSMTGDREVHQFGLSTPWDLSTISPDSKTLSVDSEVAGSAYSLVISDDGVSVYILDGDGVIYQYTLTTAWDMDTGSYSGNSYDFPDATAEAMYIHDNTIYIAVQSEIYKLTMTGGDISTAVSEGIVLSLDIDFRSGVVMQEIEFSPDGKKFYVIEAPGTTTAQFIRQYEVLEAWDLSSVVSHHRSFFCEFYDVKTLANIVSFRVGDSGDKFYTYNAYGSYVIGSPDGDYTIQEFTGISDYDLPRDIIKTRHRQFESGHFKATETSIGQIMRDMCLAMNASYSIDRRGAISVFSEDAPDIQVSDGRPYFTIRKSDLVGSAGNHIRLVNILMPVSKATVSYKKNYSPISESDTDGTVLSDSERDDLATEYKYTGGTRTPTGYDTEVLEEIYLRGHSADSSSAMDIAKEILDFRTTERKYFEIDAMLRWPGILEDFGIGSIIEIGEELGFPGISKGDYMLVVSQDINWSRNTHTLTVVK